MGPPMGCLASDLGGNPRMKLKTQVAMYTGMAAIAVGAMGGAQAGAAGCDKVASPLGSDAYRRHHRRAVRDGRASRELAVRGPDRVPARRDLPGRRGCQRGRQRKRTDHGHELPGRAGDDRRPRPGHRRGEQRRVPGAGPERAKRRQPAEPEHLRGRRRVPRQRRHERPHDDLLHRRERLVRTRPGHRDRAQPHSQLRRAARDEPPPRDLRRGLGRGAHHRQLDL